MDDKELKRELARVINCASRENLSDTPDWVLGDYLFACLEAFEDGIRKREKWYGREILGPAAFLAETHETDKGQDTK